MTKTSLFGGAALGLVCALAATTTADAAPKKHRHHHAAPESGLAAEVRDLKSQVESLQATLAAQAQAQQATQATAQAAQAQAAQSAAQAQAAQARLDDEIATIPGTVKTTVAALPPPDKIRMKGVSITPGGFLALETIYRSRGEAADISSSFNAIPFANNHQGHLDETRFTARQSRFSLLVQGDARPDVHLAGYGEFDFQSAAQTANSNESNSYNPRIRHLYATVDWDSYGLHFLGGQNWSLVTMNTKGITPRNEAPPPTIDAQYIPGFAWARQPQIRLVKDFGKTVWVAVSAENPQTTFFTVGTGTGAGTLPSNLTFNAPAGSGFNSANTLSLNHIPDVVAKVALESPFGDAMPLHVEAFGLYRNFYSRVGTSNNSVGGGGVGGGAVLSVIPKVLDLQASGLVGRGIGRYGTSQLPDATFAPDGSLQPIRESMVLAGATLHLGPELDLYLFGGREREQQQSYTGPTGLAFGYGNPLYLNTSCFSETAVGVCNANTRQIDQITGGFWHKPYQGKFGRIQWGVQYSYTERKAFEGVGGAPSTNDSMVFTSFRYYPF